MKMKITIACLFGLIVGFATGRFWQQERPKAEALVRANRPPGAIRQEMQEDAASQSRVISIFRGADPLMRVTSSSNHVVSRIYYLDGNMDMIETDENLDGTNDYFILIGDSIEKFWRLPDGKVAPLPSDDLIRWQWEVKGKLDDFRKRLKLGSSNQQLHRTQ